MWLALGKALLRKVVECGAHRRARDAQALGELVFIEARTGRQAVLVDEAADAVCQLQMQGGRNHS